MTLNRLCEAVTERAKRLPVEEDGNIVIEFALSIPLLCLTTVGVAAIGLNLDRFLQVKQLAIRAASMHRSGANLDATAVKNLLLKNGNTLRITANGGRGVIILSTVQRASSGTNQGLAVISHRIVIGDSSRGSSALGSPVGIQPNGHVANFEANAAALATLPAGIDIPMGEKRYFAEVIHHSERRFNFPGIVSIENLKARSVY